MCRPIVFAAVVLFQSPPSAAQAPNRQAAVIGDFNRITAVAVSSQEVFATSPSALVIWNPVRESWRGPIAPPAPITLDRVFAGLVDPLDNSLWLARTDGWVRYIPEPGVWAQGLVPGQVQDIAFDLSAPTAGLFLRTATGWLTVTRGGGAPTASPPPKRPLRSATVSDALRANPGLQKAGGAGGDVRLRGARYTAAAPGFGGAGWYLGTWGMGLLYLSAGAAVPERLTFGLPGSDITALLAGPGGVWVANDRTEADGAGVTFVSSDLGEFRWLPGSADRPLPFGTVRDLVMRNGQLWIATEVGVARLTPESGDLRLFDPGYGLPDRQALAIEGGAGQIVVGTPHGAALISDSLVVTRLAPGYKDSALAVLVVRDTVWIGTPRGLFAAVPDNADLLSPRQSGGPSLAVRIAAISWRADTLVALTSDGFLWRNPRNGEWTVGPVLSTFLGELRTLIPYRDGFYVGGDRGVAFARLNTIPIHPLLWPTDLPAGVQDLATDDEYLWVGTSKGLIRFRLEAIWS